MSHYITHYTGGDRCSDNRDMTIMLYPNSGSSLDNCTKYSEIATALDDAGSSLYSYGSTNYYEIMQFDAEQYGYPEVDTSSKDTIISDFRSWLQDGSSTGNDTGYDLYSAIGCHYLVYDASCTENTTGGERHDSCSDYYADPAFTDGVIMFTGVCDDLDLRRNSAVQEALHPFINYGIEDIQTLAGNASEHSLGEVDGSGYVTPMLTYWDDEYGINGDCSGQDIGSKYKQNLTWCTKEAIKKTSRNQCGSGQGNYC